MNVAHGKHLNELLENRNNPFLFFLFSYSFFPFPFLVEYSVLTVVVDTMVVGISQIGKRENILRQFANCE